MAPTLAATARRFGEMATKAVHPFSDRLSADRHTPFGEQILDIGRAECEAVVDPYCIDDDLAWEAVTFQAGHGGWNSHRKRLNSHETLNKLAMSPPLVSRIPRAYWSIMVYGCTNPQEAIMPRQTITLSDPNHAWLQARVDSGEFKTQTEAVNDALRRAREIENGVEEIREKLIRAEQRGFTDLTPDQILERSKKELRANGDL